ncbi:MAG: outer membrane protein assembly factor BamA, partial [Pseudomonadota bacterium]
MRRAAYLGTTLWLVFAACCMSVHPTWAQTRINAIKVEGNQRVPSSTVVSLTELSPGQSVTSDDISDALQRVLASGLFETAEIVPTGSGLRVIVAERPTVDRISIEGNQRLSDEELLPLVTSTPRRVYTPSQAEADAAALADAYAARARLAARVAPRIIRRSGNRVDLVFEISEGAVVENERISFVGNRAFSDRRLRRVIDSKQAGLLRQLIQRDTFIAERIPFDRQLLTDFYRSRGYIDFQVLDVSTQLTQNRDATFLTFNVREGQQFEIGAVSVSSEFAQLDLADYRDALRIRSGQTWSPRLVDEQVERLERLTVQQGLDFARVDPRVTRNNRDLSLDIEFAIIRGPRIFVERIDIEGNQTTLDRVIRSQFDTVEGDPFNPREIRNAAERIRALGFFANADVNTREGTASDQIVVDVDVEEQPTGNLTFGGAFSDDTGFSIGVGFSERNFLGRGQLLAVDVQTGGENQTADISFREPALLGRDLTLGLDFTFATTDFDNSTFDTEELSFSPSLTFPTGENSRLQVFYEIAREDIVDISPDASQIIQDEDGSLIRSSIGYRYTFDLLRGGLNPNRGVRLTFGQEFAGIGGDVEFIRTTAIAVAERDIAREEVTVRAILEGGLINSIGGGTT